MMILDRPWHASWEYRPELLDVAADRVRVLHEAAARPGPGDPAAVGEVCRLLVHDLGVSAAVDVAADTGGDAARLLISVLGLA
jgi:cysteinyl-tRNA synthetase